MVDRALDATAYNQGLEDGRRESTARIKLLEERLIRHVETCSTCNGNGSYEAVDAVTGSNLIWDCTECEEDRKALGRK